MKIQEIGVQQQAGVTQARTGVREPGAAAEAFASVLDEALTATGAQTATGALAASGTAQQPDSVAALLLSDISGTEAQKSCLDAVESAMGKIETVSTMLGQQNVDAKAVDALLGAAKSEAEGLQEKLSALPESHPLRQIGEELNVLAYTESMKWQRGDYL
jgi:hypothetical protein